MSKFRRAVAGSLFALLFVVMAGVLFAQFGRYFQPRYNENQPPATSEFVFSRWEYATNSGGWSHDYPAAEEHINQLMSEATGISVERMSYRIIPIESDDIFKYPFGYISEPGQMTLT